MENPINKKKPFWALPPNPSGLFFIPQNFLVGGFFPKINPVPRNKSPKLRKRKIFKIFLCALRNPDFFGPKNAQFKGRPTLEKKYQNFPGNPPVFLEKKKFKPRVSKKAALIKLVKKFF